MFAHKLLSDRIPTIECNRKAKNPLTTYTVSINFSVLALFKNGTKHLFLSPEPSHISKKLKSTADSIKSGENFDDLVFELIPAAQLTSHEPAEIKIKSSLGDCYVDDQQIFAAIDSLRAKFSGTFDLTQSQYKVFFFVLNRCSVGNIFPFGARMQTVPVTRKK